MTAWVTGPIQGAATQPANVGWFRDWSSLPRPVIPGARSLWPGIGPLSPDDTNTRWTTVAYFLSQDKRFHGNRSVTLLVTSAANHPGLLASIPWCCMGQWVWGIFPTRSSLATSTSGLTNNFVTVAEWWTFCGHLVRVVLSKRSAFAQARPLWADRRQR